MAHFVNPLPSPRAPIHPHTHTHKPHPHQLVELLCWAVGDPFPDLKKMSSDAIVLLGG